MKRPPHVHVYCDLCSAAITVNLMTLENGSYDERNLKAVIVCQGWRIVDGQHICNLHDDSEDN